MPSFLEPIASTGDVLVGERVVSDFELRRESALLLLGTSCNLNISEFVELRKGYT